MASPPRACAHRGVARGVCGSAGLGEAGSTPTAIRSTPVGVGGVAVTATASSPARRSKTPSIDTSAGRPDRPGPYGCGPLPLRRAPRASRIRLAPRGQQRIATARWPRHARAIRDRREVGRTATFALRSYLPMTLLSPAGGAAEVIVRRTSSRYSLKTKKPRTHERSSRSRTRL